MDSSLATICTRKDDKYKPSCRPPVGKSWSSGYLGHIRWRLCLDAVSAEKNTFNSPFTCKHFPFIDNFNILLQNVNGS